MPDPRQGRVYDDPSGHSLRIERRERITDHVAYVVSDECGLFDPELVQDPRETPRLRGRLVALLWMGRQSHAAQVGHDHGVVVDEAHREWLPHVPGISKAVQQDDGAALAPDADILGAVRHRHLLRVETGRPVPDRSMRRRRRYQ